MPEYEQPDLELAAEKRAAADEAYAEGAESGTTADDYVRITVLLASVLFLVGISGHFRVHSARVGPALRQRGDPHLRRRAVDHGAQTDLSRLASAGWGSGRTTRTTRAPTPGTGWCAASSPWRSWWPRWPRSAVWLWLRPLREGPAQSFGLWLGCMLLVGCAVLVWSPEHRRRAPGSRRVREWLVVGVLVAVSGLMALIGVVVAREDRRPVLRGIVEMAVAGQPVTFERGDDVGLPAPLRRRPRPQRLERVPHVRGDRTAGPGGRARDRRAGGRGGRGGRRSHRAGRHHPRYGEVRVEGDAGDRLVVCVDEVDPANRCAPTGTAVRPAPCRRRRPSGVDAGGGRVDAAARSSGGRPVSGRLVAGARRCGSRASSRRRDCGAVAGGDGRPGDGLTTARR